MSKCIICDTKSEHFMKTESYDIYKCPTCGLAYSMPMQLPDSAEAFFTAAYGGKLKDPGMLDLVVRQRWMQQRKRFKADDFLRGAHKDALKWIKANVPAGSTILDIGCGPGAFLYALRSEGFHGVGVEPSIDTVKILQTEGFDAYCGTMENIPSECPTPFAVTSFFVLHHLIDPLRAVAAVKARYPKAYFLLAAYKADYSKHLPPSSLPPRALTSWTKESLQLLFFKAGYKQVHVVQCTWRPQEYTVPIAATIYKHVGRWLPAGVIWPLWHKFKRYFFWPVATAERIAKHPRVTLLAIGRPTG